MATVAEVLKTSGWTDEQIKALDEKSTKGFTAILNTAQQAKEAAEEAQRIQAAQYDQDIAPALDAWGNEKTSLEAQVAFYKTQAEGAKAAGFIPQNAPSAPPRNETGQFVAGANSVPGSPDIVKNVERQAASAVGSMLDLQWKHQALYNKPMPDSPTQIIREATARRMDPITYASQKYKFSEREQEITAKAKEDERNAIIRETEERKDREWSEKVGSNPNIRPAEASRFSSMEKGVKEGARPDPLKLSKEQRRAATRDRIQSEIRENQNTVH